ncbi:MAG: hypothetical protein RLZZ175_965 [Bacteroidota bacterium]|jgi:septal ring factor EnvC (AmiA/AmiB activator)
MYAVKSKFILFFLLAFVAYSQVFAQKSRAELEREKRENIRKIEEANRILAETKHKKKSTIGQLRAIEGQIKSSERQIKLISQELNLIDREIGNIETDIVKLQITLENLKKEYALMIYAASKASNGYNKLTYLFASKTFNQLAMRLKYLTFYADARRDQVAHIHEVTGQLTNRKNQINNKKKEKENLIVVEKNENNTLHQLKGEQTEVVKELSKKEKEIQEDLEDKKRSVRKLDNLIADMVRREIEKSRKAANNNNTTSSTNKITLTPEAAALSANFAENKSRLPWPVRHGFISHEFGRQPHPVLKGVVVDNLGIDIQTNRGEEVRAVFKGKVIAVAEVPGMGNVVMVQHGEYFTVYAKLKTVLVISGQKLNAKDMIGYVSTDKDDLTELQFQIWKNSTKLNPADWLYNK